MRPGELAVLGSGLAGLSHEFKNVLAIVGESTGLVGDLIEIDGPEGVDERVTRAFGCVTRQLERANRMVSLMNRFAHAFDDPDASLPVGEIVTQAVFLVDRRARSRDVSIERELRPAHAANLAGPQPARLVLALASALFAGLSKLPPSTRLRITSDGDWILVSGDLPVDALPSGTADALAEALVDAGCAVRPPDASKGELISIRLP